ncbi:MAG TPA: hypothetical protein VJU14_12500 [Solirubrobacterales bacterium]|nr:hypothetical protein [Solirubrobacterales bacterium]
MAELTLSSFELEGSNGYEVEVSAAREGRQSPTALIRAIRGPFESHYIVPAALGAGIHATFGSLGQLDISFERRSKEVHRTGPGCRSITESGVFRGSFRFAGEGGYFSAEATDPAGEVLRLPNGFCAFDSFRAARPAIPALSKTALSAQAKEGSKTLSFEATRLHLEPRTLFRASLRERVGPMEVEHITAVSGKKRTFITSNESRASVRPPWPFEGSARFRDPARGPATLTGSLSVPLPGASPVALTGDFTVKLCPRVPILSNCLRGQPGPFRYGSGSHSQPLALARLSSLR